VPQPSGPTESVIDKAVHKELGGRMVRDATIASSLGVEQDSGDTIAQTRFKSISKHSNDSLLARGNTLQSDKDSMKLDELMAIRTNLQNRVLDLEQTKTTQKNKIASLKRSVKKLKKRNSNEESLGKDASKQERRIDAINADEDITLVNDADKEMFDVDDLGGEEVFVAGQNENIVKEVVNAAQVSTAATTITITTEEITLAQALKALKTSKPKVKGIFVQDQPSDPIEHVVDEAVYKELGDSLVRAAITASSLEAEQDSEMFDVDDLGGKEVYVSKQDEHVVEEVVDAAQVNTVATTATITTEEMNLA
nr:hypothetical protein [Tanacetum cinerariifolium]